MPAMNYFLNTKALEFGTKHEPFARQLYFRKNKVWSFSFKENSKHFFFYILKSFICEGIYFDKEFFDEM